MSVVRVIVVLFRVFFLSRAALAAENQVLRKQRAVLQVSMNASLSFVLPRRTAGVIRRILPAAAQEA
jgi:hypothetical protein